MYSIKSFVDSSGQKTLLLQETDDITLIQVLVSICAPVMRGPNTKGA
jgi:hypothetical protein